MSKLIINGGKKLSGTVIPTSNKNQILKLIPAAILIDGDITFTNVPMSTSVRVLIDIFTSLGGTAEYIEGNKLKLNSSGMNSSEIDDELAAKERSSLIFLGPLTARFGMASIRDAGGCKLGTRPLDTLFQGLRELGVNIEGENKYRLNAPKGIIANDNIWLVEASVTGTETLILAAVKAKGRTVIYHAACEPHTQELCKMLNACGAQISGIGSNKLIIDGVDHLKAPENFECEIISDHIDIIGLVVAGAIIGNGITIKNAIPEHMKGPLQHLEKIGLVYSYEGNDLIIPEQKNLFCKPNFKGDLDKITDQPWPGFPVDAIPQVIVMAAFTGGNLRITSNMYETQLFFIEQLNGMGGKVYLASPHTVITMGPSKFRGGKFVAPQIIQSAHALMLAALTVDGSTTIENIDVLMRRYPDIVDELKVIGADIEIVKD